MKTTNGRNILILAFLMFNLCSYELHSQNSDSRRQLFDFDWKFFLGDNMEASKNNFNDNTWRSLDLPHDWSIEGKFDRNSPTLGDGGFLPGGTGWYRKKFSIPADWKDKSTTIYFEGVYMNSEVFVNGHSLGIHPYGYTSFAYDISNYLDYGKENLIAVRVDNSQQRNCRWYSGSGIYRHVWMEVSGKIHVAHWGVSITTPEVEKKRATVVVKTIVKNETASPQNITVSTRLADKTSKTVGMNDAKVELPANSEKEVEQSVSVNDPFLWSPSAPDLYQADIMLVQDKKMLDAVKNTFGIRSIKFTPENGFELNGESIKMNGGCVHHDNGCLGAKAYDRAEERRVELLKAAGFNAVRTSHNPPSEAFLNACDRLGLLVIDEAFDGWRTSKNKYDYAMYFDEWWKRDLEAMILRDRNHPSIVLWSIGNEIIERKEPQAVQTAKNLAGLIHQTDPTRPVTSAMTTWDKSWEIYDPLMAAHDVCGYNYMLYKAESDHARVPSRIIVQTESYPRDAFKNWATVHQVPYVIGDFVWTALDYLGESGIGRYYYKDNPKGEHWQGNLFPWHGAYCGDVDLMGWRKPISHYRNILWNSTEKLYMAVREPNPANDTIRETMWSVWPTWESWTWPGYEGKEIEVEVYSKYQRVRLYLNDKLIGEKPTTQEQEFKATFSVPYISGTLKAVGIENDKEAGSTILKTAGTVSQIRLKADRTSLNATGQDLSFVTVELTDENGTVQPNAENLLQFNISGPGVIVGVDNANVKDTASYTGSTRKAWKGKALVVIKSTREKGDIKLTVSSDGLKQSSVSIITRSNDTTHL